MARTVAVIVTAYNRADQLDAALASIEAQTVEDLDILVIDDASSDQTPAVCRRHEAADPRVRTIRMETNVGAANARNAGLDAVDATYVAFMDGDDHADPCWIEDLLQAAHETGVPLVAAGHVVDVDTGPRGVVSAPSRPVDRLTLVPAQPGTVVHPQPFIWAMGYCWNKLYLRSAIEAHAVRFDPRLPLFEDMWFNLDLMRVVPAAAFISSAQYHYVQHGADRLTNRPQAPDLRFRAQLARRLSGQLEAWGLQDQTRAVLGAVIGWSISVECSRTTPPGLDAVPALREALPDRDVQWLLERAVQRREDLRRADRPVVGALRAGRVRRARVLARSVWALASVRARVGARLAAR
ncbi:glycosyltransferase family 2 protein [Nocardioides sp. SYSU DS0663]|uniref:glycosyltransferase family 2 protein n=1 Tax=Nocardioides sp. SYSU DS0663 TaxID=3416445 RepID=UPI003F4C148D